jgi:uncharacterized protein YbcC (UPF0753/DUF2309 family)
MMEIVITNLWRTADKAGNSWTQWRQPIRPRVSIESEHMAAVANLYDAAQLRPLAGLISSLSEMEFHGLIEELKSFDDFERRRLLHLAYERRHEREVLAPLNSHRRTIDPNGSTASFSGHGHRVFFCIDEREESMRRALEEAASGGRDRTEQRASASPSTIADSTMCTAWHSARLSSLHNTP